MQGGGGVKFTSHIRIKTIQTNNHKGKKKAKKKKSCPLHESQIGVRIHKHQHVFRWMETGLLDLLARKLEDLSGGTSSLRFREHPSSWRVPEDGMFASGSVSCSIACHHA
jgi:hypothetical protein